MTVTPPDQDTLLTLPLHEIKRLAREHGYHVTAVVGGYKVQHEDDIGSPSEGTDYDLSFLAETEDLAYATIRDQLWRQADIRRWIAARQAAQRLH
jgi:hypothetical protein